VPLAALPRGERRVIVQDGDEILLLWYKDEVFAIENRSPAEGAYSEGLLNAKLTQVIKLLGKMPLHVVLLVTLYVPEQSYWPHLLPWPLKFTHCSCSK
jgi:hypothetical protein